MTLAGSNFNLDLVFFLLYFPLSYIEESYAFHDRKMVQLCIFPCTASRDVVKFSNPGVLSVMWWA